MVRVYFSSGSNQGNRLNSLVQAARLIDKRVGKIIQYSPVVETEPWGFKAETSFYNQVLMVETQYSPQQVLNKVLEIEQQLGRIRSGKGYSSRMIDIDILFYDEIQLAEHNLVIPHPLLHERKFVLEPLAAIAPGLIHPVLHKTISELLQQLKDTSPVISVVEKAEFTRLFNQ